jgi:hypothetical protein
LYDCARDGRRPQQPPRQPFARPPLRLAGPLLLSLLLGRPSRVVLPDGGVQIGADVLRAAFDGDRGVDAVIDLALRIHDARTQLGAMPTGPARVIWQQQWTALDAAAERLSQRADALIRHREQAAQLSRELAELERSVLVVDDLTIATSMGATAPGSARSPTTSPARGQQCGSSSS